MAAALRIATCALVLAGAALVAAPAVAQTLSEVRNLRFGIIALGPTSGPVSVFPGGGQSCSPHTCLGGDQTGRYQIQDGLPLQTIGITFSMGDVLTRQGGSETLALENLASSTGATVTLNLLGSATFDVGGDLQVDAASPTGNYDGTYTVTLENP